MGFEFFTFGGSQFWADVFFYQKWRIQRNCVSKSYRLLDSWDIVRHRGTFEECRKAFVNYIDIYELPRQSGPMIVMLHGFGENKNIFKPLWRKALDRGYMAAAVNYPSMQCNIESHVRQLIFCLTIWKTPKKFRLFLPASAESCCASCSVLTLRGSKNFESGESYKSARRTTAAV